MGLLSKWAESLDYEYEILKSCTRYLSPRSTCQKCMDVCEKNAIHLVNNKPVVTEEKCAECGDCISSCPVQAVAGIFPKRTVIGDQLLITDEHVSTAKELLVFYKKGVRGIISEESTLPEAWKSVIETANSLLRQLGEEPFVVTAKAYDKTDQHYSRRELFALWKKESQSIMKEVAPAKWRFNHSQLDVTNYYPAYQFVSISVNIDKCTLCKACERLCAKKCLNISETGFSITAQGCSSCQLCADICPEQAIQVREQISSVQNMSYPLYKKTCRVCHHPFNTLREEDEKCVRCTKSAGYLSPNAAKL